MGERTEFKPGMRAPNDGTYMEIGDNDVHMGINNPQQITLKAGDPFPDTTNDDRVWKKKKQQS
ncbi:YjzC family protein [Paenibacillus koleovorans]|uniref:YjzC family protein n=1 Tax=Paenibacillus koleovorans TaxID=121608 RepID=UPI000FDCAB9C|nr:YjzC family protein [Paenibacillus koleovorans]